ncbi:hypothetical protein [Actinomadura hibisca]|uniref:hypothetical protein n=1 Tax=Actinomadura hibisca TaxID=68565 RepID=UPI000833D1C6|nr:hypothetical protein [Actinomadura hibisca]
MGAATLYLTGSGDVSSLRLVPALLIFGFVLAGVDDHEGGSAAGVLEANQQLAGAVGVAALPVVPAMAGRRLSR